MRLNKAYDHVDKHLAGQPASIDERRNKQHLLERKKNEKGQKKQAEMWAKKSKMIKRNIQTKRDEFRRRMKAIKAENRRREKAIRQKLKEEKANKERLQKDQKKMDQARQKAAKAKADADYKALLAKNKK